MRVTEDTAPIAESTPIRRTRRTKVPNVVLPKQTPPITDGSSSRKMKKAKEADEHAHGSDDSHGHSPGGVEIEGLQGSGDEEGDDD